MSQSIEDVVLRTNITLVSLDAYSTSQVDAVVTTKDTSIVVADCYSTSQVDAVVTTKNTSIVVADCYSVSQVDVTPQYVNDIGLGYYTLNLVVQDLYSTSQVDAPTVIEYIGVNDAYSTTQVDGFTSALVIDARSVRVTWIQFELPPSTASSIHGIRCVQHNPGRFDYPS